MATAGLILVIVPPGVPCARNWALGQGTGCVPGRRSRPVRGRRRLRADLLGLDDLTRTGAVTDGIGGCARFSSFLLPPIRPVILRRPAAADPARCVAPEGR